MRQLLSPKFHEAVFVIAIALLIIGLPVSKFLMSVSQIVLIANWILEGDLKHKFTEFFRNKPAFILSSLLFIHVIALLYSTDLTYGFKDVRIKLPLFLLPLIFSTSKPISKETFRIFLQLFLGSIFVATIISTLILTGIGIHRKVVDIRDISIFISHIRFGLLICIAIFIAVYLLTKSTDTWLKILYSIFICWLFVFLIILESVTGLSALLIASFVLLLVKGLRATNKLIKWGGILISLGTFALLIYFYKLFRDTNKVITQVNKSVLLKRTAQGNLYDQDTTNHETENGYLVWINYSMKEMEAAWNQRSQIKFRDKDLKGNVLWSTLVRFLASKGLNKDAAAVNSLTAEDVRAIERGVPNVDYKNISSLKGRIREIIWEIDLYKKTGDANGHSLTQRFEYWKTASMIIKNNLLIGVGTGDVAAAFDKEYIQSNSSLYAKWRLRAHNQYLSIAVGMGLIGLLWFLITLFYPMYKLKMQFNYLYMAFFIIALVSFFTEDTLETQAGVTFFAFFNSFFLFLQPYRKEEL
jgi:hypothetical protein